MQYLSISNGIHFEISYTIYSNITVDSLDKKLAKIYEP